MAVPVYRVRVVSVRKDVLTCVAYDLWSAGALRMKGGEFLVPSRTVAFWLLLELLEGMEDGGKTYMGMSCPVTPAEARARAKNCCLARSLPDRPQSVSEQLNDEEEFVKKNARRYIRKVEVIDKQYCGLTRYRRRDPLPRATYRIIVTDSRWLEHVVPRTRFETTVYPLEAKYGH